MSSSPPLTPRTADAVVDAVAALLGGINRIATPDLLAAVEELDLPVAQIKVLILLERRGPLGGAAIARELSLSLPSTSRACEGLVVTGLAVRRESDDRRVRLVEVTDDGRALVARLAGVRQTAIEQVVAQLGPDERARLESALAPLARLVASVLGEQGA